MQTAPEVAELAGFPGKGEEVGLIPGAAQNQNFCHWGCKKSSKEKSPRP
jgi:hypothetical protein